MRMYILFKKPELKESLSRAFVRRSPRCARNDSNAALGRGVYATDVG